VAATTTTAAVNGAVIAAMSQNDTGNNPHNPMYAIAATGSKGSLLTLIGTQSTVSGGNSAAPAAMIDPTLQPTKIASASDDVGLAGGATVTPDGLAVMQSQVRISGGTSPSTVAGSLASVQAYPANATADSQLKDQVRCAYVQSANNADAFKISDLDPTQDTDLVALSAPFAGNSDIAKTAAVAKLVVNGFAGAGTITLGGYDYHDSTRATGETRNAHAGNCIGLVLEYAARKGKPVMIYVFSDGSLSSTGMADNSAAGRGKLGWQGDNQSTASTFFLVYSPKGRPQLRNGAASQQIGYFSSDGSVVSTSSPAANSVNQLVQTVILNYLGLLGQDSQFSTLFPTQGLGSATAQAALTAFAPIA
jgi:hypothetical protein